MLGIAPTTVSSSSTRSRCTGSGSTGCCGPKGTILLLAIVLLLLLKWCDSVDPIQLVMIIRIDISYLHTEQLCRFIFLQGSAWIDLGNARDLLVLPHFKPQCHHPVVPASAE